MNIIISGLLDDLVEAGDVQDCPEMSRALLCKWNRRRHPGLLTGCDKWSVMEHVLEPLPCVTSRVAKRLTQYGVFTRSLQCQQLAGEPLAGRVRQPSRVAQRKACRTSGKRNENHPLMATTQRSPNQNLPVSPRSPLVWNRNRNKNLRNMYHQQFRNQHCSDFTYFYDLCLVIWVTVRGCRIDQRRFHVSFTCRLAEAEVAGGSPVIT